MFRTQFPTPFALLLALSASSLSCSVLIDTKTKQCSADSDCASLGDAFKGSVCDLSSNVCVAPQAMSALGCVEATPSSDPKVKLSFNVSLTVAPKEQHPFTIKACGPLDYDCVAPVADVVTVAYGDPAEILVPKGFQGLIEVTTPDALPGIEFLGRPIVQDTAGYDLILPTSVTVALLLLATGQDYDPDQGIFVITTRDCDRQPLAGVSVSNSAGGVGFYFQNQSPQKTLTETTSEGAAGFVNVPPGLVSIGATRGGRPMSGTSAISRGGWVTYVEIFP